MRVYFDIYGEEFPLEEFTKDMRISPIRTTKKGQRYPQEREEAPLARETSWAYGMEEMTVTVDPEIQFNWLVDQLTEKIEIINSYRKQYNLSCKLVAVIEYTNESNRGFALNKRFISFANVIGAWFDSDIYIE